VRSKSEISQQEEVSLLRKENPELKRKISVQKKQSHVSLYSLSRHDHLIPCPIKSPNSQPALKNQKPHINESSKISLNHEI
jgi:hypothetical protein